MARFRTWVVGGALAALVVGVAGVARPTAPAVAAAPLFAVSPAQQTVDLSAGTMQVKVTIQDASNVASFMFTLTYDPGVITSPVFAEGAFLGSSGRSVNCLAPIQDRYGPGTVAFGCATLGNGAGAGGPGTLATVTFKLAGGADSTIGLERASLSDAPFANQICAGASPGYCAVQGGAVHVNGGDPSKDQGVAPTPTAMPIAAAPTSAPGTRSTPDAGAGAAGSSTPAAGTVAPVDAAAGAALGPSGTVAGGGSASPGGTGSVAGAGAGTGAVAGASGPGTSVGRFGYGPQQQDNNGGGLAVAAAALALAGAALVGGSCAARRRMRVR